VLMPIGESDAEQATLPGTPHSIFSRIRAVERRGRPGPAAVRRPVLPDPFQTSR
jgi:hypothetical protein